MVTVERNVGRLIEVRTVGRTVQSDVDSLGPRLVGLMTSVPGKVVTCADLRFTGIVSEAMANQLIERMRRDNPLIERSALVIGNNQGMLGLQVERMAREAGNPARRVMRYTEDAEAWLGELLTKEEKARLHDFLAWTPPPK
jgi:hypothetical protein